MKKFVLGCLAVLVLLTIAGGVAGYLFVYRPAKSYIASLAQLQEIPGIEARVSNRQSFTPPENGELTEALVSRYVAAQKALHDTLGGRLEALDAKYDALHKASGGNPSFSDGLTALRDLGTLIVEAKRAQVDALNAQGFSLAEYDWTRQAVYAAAGMPMGPEFQQIIKQAQSGQLQNADSVAEAAVGPVPEKNKELVAPHTGMLRENAALAFFGL